MAQNHFDVIENEDAFLFCWVKGDTNWCTRSYRLRAMVLFLFLAPLWQNRNESDEYVGEIESPK